MKAFYSMMLLLAMAVVLEAKPAQKEKKETPKEESSSSEKKDAWLNLEITPAEKEIIKEYVVQWQEKEGKDEDKGKAEADDKKGKGAKGKKEGKEDDDNKKGKGPQTTKTWSLPPGLAKKVARDGELPPGWQKKVAKGEVLPESVYKGATQHLPDEIKVKLPKPPPGTVLLTVDGKLVRLVEATRTILDVCDLQSGLPH